MVFLLTAAAIILFLGLTLFLYARFIEPRRIKTVFRELESPRVTKSADGLRIVQFSDVHISHDDLPGKLKRLTENVNQAGADLLVFTGDLFDDFRNYPFDRKAVSAALGNMKARYAKIAVWGNHDYSEASRDIFRETLESGGFTVLQSESRRFEDLGITISGYDDALYGQKADEFHPDGGEDFHLILVHEPDAGKIIDQDSYDLMLSGHTHGGQVRVPLLGVVYTPKMGQRALAGWFAPRGREHRGRLYVNSGIGGSMLPIRFAVPPELTVMMIRHTDKERHVMK